MQTPTPTSERLTASAGSASFRDPAFRAKFIFGQKMKACPKCKGYNIGFSTPIKLDATVPDTAKGMLSAWAKARKGGSTPLEGTCRIMCRSCGHLGPAVNVEGRTAEDVGRDKAVCDEVKRLWNSEQNVTPSRPKALDLFCCAGGAAMGLHRAGYDVTGVDIRPQPRYQFRFIQGDALAQDLSGYDFVWASPPCQAHTSMKTMHNAKKHPDLIPATRAKLEAWGGLWIMENVVGAPLRNPVLLCGTMFGLGCEDAELRRHRIFESNVALMTLECRHGQRAATMGVYGGHLRNRKRVRTIGVYGEGVRDSVRKMDKGVQDFDVNQGREAMGIEWMTLAELCQAIPPAYSEFLARQVIGVTARRNEPSAGTGFAR